jgi:hypothetical protein
MSDLTPLRPREFFGRPWTGRGEVVPRLLPRWSTRRFSFRSECEFLKVPLGPLRVRFRFHDRCWLDDEDVLHDEIEMCRLGVRLATIRMQLTRSD